MSYNFRPVQEIWGEASSVFIGHDELLALFAELAQRVATEYDEGEYGELTAVWFENGKGLLDYIESNPNFNPLSLHETLSNNGYEIEEKALGALMHNMKNLVPVWRKSLHEGALRFYVD